MTEENNVTELTSDSKPRFRDRLKKTSTEAEPKTKKPLKAKVKDAAAVVGVVTLAGVVAAAVAKKTSKDVVTESTEPVVVTEDN